jgi:hypothetical protein
MQTVQLYINNQRVDLFNDETISVNTSIQNVKDISKIFTDFSQTFTIPASKTNNKLFKHFGDSSIIDGFDARFRTEARIELNNVEFKKGSIRLNKVIKKEGLPYAYDITFFGSLANLNKILGTDKLKDLTNELSAYNHAWTYDNIVDGLETGLQFNTDTQAIIYPLISPVRRFIFNSNDIYTAEDDTANIGSISTAAGLRPQDLKPAIRIIRVIEAIEAKYPQIQFSRDFFGGILFNDLYLWLHRQAGQISSASGTSERIISDFSLVSQTLGCGNNYAIFTTNYFSIITGGDFSNGVDAQAALTITPNNIDVDYTYKIIDLVTDEVLFENTAKGQSIQTINIGAYYDPEQEWRIQVQISTEDSAALSSYSAEWYIQTYYYVNGERDCSDIQEYAVSSQNMLTDIIVANQMPDIKVIDFLTGLFKMFNLTSYVEDTEIIVKDLNTFYGTYETYNITDFVSSDNIEINRVPLYSEVDFTFKEPTTFLAKQFSETNGINYGQEKYTVTKEDSDFVDGEQYNVEAPFEKLVYERLNDVNDSALTTAQYGYFVDNKEAKVLGSPLVFLNVPTDSSDKPIYFRDFNDTNIRSLDTYNRPSNVASNNVQTINFSSEVDEFLRNTNDNSLFKTFYQSYISNVFNKRNRLTSLTAFLPFNILTKYRLNDRFIIGDKEYRINTIQTELNSGKSTLELLSIITDEFVPVVITCPTADNDEVRVDSTLYTVDCGDEVCATADNTVVTVDNDSLTVDCGDPIPTTTTTTSTTTTSTTSTTTTLATTTAGTTTTAPTTTVGTTTTAGTTTAGTTTTTTATPCIQRIVYSGIPEQSIQVGGNKTINLNTYFTQLDGQPLSYIAIATTDLLDSVSLAGSQLTMFANTGNLCGTDGSGVFIRAYDSISENCSYATYFTADVFGCTSTSTTTAATTSTTTSTTTAGTTTAGTTTTLPTTTTTIAPTTPSGTINTTFVGYESTGANFDVYTIDAVDAFIDFTIYPTGGGSYFERYGVPTVNGTLVNWTISWNGDIYTGDGGTGTANLVVTNNLGTESTLDTDSFVIPASGSTTTTTAAPVCRQYSVQATDGTVTVNYRGCNNNEFLTLTKNEDGTITYICSRTYPTEYSGVGALIIDQGTC